MREAIALFLALLAMCGPTYAATGDPIDLQTRFGRFYESFIVNEDGTAVESYEWSLIILKETALEWSKRATVGYSTSAEKAEIVAAYTLKADGRKIEVPKDNYQIEVNKGKGKDSPVYSDWTTLTVVFPDVAVGDTVVFSYRLILTKPMFPKHYSLAQTFNDQIAYDDVRVRFDYPSSMWVQFESRGMKETENGAKGDRKIVEWRYANPRPLKTERRDFSIFDPDKTAGYSFSTFKTFADIAIAYGEGAQSKAAVTERVTDLAAEIVKDKKTPKDQARAIYEWVSTNITYAGNCIGIGAVVPRDVSVILDNKMGDCKDHATLLQALLAARGIKSVQALVNAGPIYRLPKIPYVSAVNHVFNYLPEFDLYMDSTSNSTPFGMLPFVDQDKPVLLVEGFKEGMKTPVPPVGSNLLHSKSSFMIAPDGAVSGSVEFFLNGPFAADMRAWARKISKEAEDDLVKYMFRAQDKIGSGKFEKDDPTGLSDRYHFKTSFNAEKFIKFPGTGAFYLSAPFRIVSSIQILLKSYIEPEKESDIACASSTVIEDYVIELPKKLKMLSIPNNMKVSNEFLSYFASYKLKGNVLTVRRELDIRTKGNICSPQALAESKKIAEQVIDNLKEQALYK